MEASIAMLFVEGVMHAGCLTTMIPGVTSHSGSPPSTVRGHTWNLSDVFLAWLNNDAKNML